MTLCYEKINTKQKTELLFNSLNELKYQLDNTNFGMNTKLEGHICNKCKDKNLKKSKTKNLVDEGQNLTLLLSVHSSLLSLCFHHSRRQLDKERLLIVNFNFVLFNVSLFSTL